MASRKDIVDAVSADLEDLVLPDHILWKYLEPPVVRADQKPMLAVFMRETRFTVMADTDEYQADDALVVQWFQSTGTSLERPALNQDVAESVLDTAETLTSRLRTYGPAVVGLDDQSEADVVLARYGLVDGGTFMVEIQCMARTWPT